MTVAGPFRGLAPALWAGQRKPIRRKRRAGGTGPVGPTGALVAWDASEAVMSGLNVASVPNRGTGGAAYDLTAGTTAIQRVDTNRAMKLIAVNSDFLTYGTPIPVLGSWVMVVLDRSTLTQSYPMGGTVRAGGNMAIRLFNETAPNGVAASILRVTQDGAPNVEGGFFPRESGVLALLEWRVFPDGRMRTMYNGGAAYRAAGEYPSGVQPADYTMLGKHPVSTPSFNGNVYAQRVLLLDATDADANAARTELATAYGITLVPDWNYAAP